MGTKVVGDDVDFFLFVLAGNDLAQEVYELRAGMARSGLAQHLAGARVERRVPRKSPMPVILKAGALGPTPGKGQHRIKSVKSLAGTLFVHIKDRRGLRWGRMQLDNLRLL